MEKITRDELKKMLDRGDDFALIEVLAREEYREFHLPGAINVPLSDSFEEEVAKVVPDKSKPVVVYCSDVECSASPKAAQKLEEEGYQSVHHYAEGKTDWREAGLRGESEERAA